MTSSPSHALPRDTIPPAIETLNDATSLLKAFTHRNKNQHASSHWFSHLSTLRRNLARLRDELSALEAEDRAHEVHHQRQQPKKGKPHRDDGKQTAQAKRVARVEIRTVKRVTWMRNHVVPRSYVAFTQLVADNQYSALGLFLLSLLAKVHTLLASLIPSAEQGQQPLTWKLPAASVPDGSARLSSVEPSTESHCGKDRGQVISRENLSSRTGLVKRKLPALSSSVNDDPEVSVNGSKGRPPARDKRNAHVDGAEGNSKKGPGPPKVAKKEKDKKQKRKKGDEFSSLFGSL